MISKLLTLLKLKEQETNKFLGRHVILDIWGTENSEVFLDISAASKVLKEIAINAGATVLDERWHHFGEGNGYTGVIILAESHISVHTWPEYGHAAVDIFMCGEPDPRTTVKPIVSYFKANKYSILISQRGQM